MSQNFFSLPHYESDHSKTKIQRKIWRFRAHHYFLPVVLFFALSCQTSAFARDFGQADLLNLGQKTCSTPGPYKLGVGIGDITGGNGLTLIGYGKFNQISNGVMLRVWARAFIIEFSDDTLVVFVSIDCGLMGHGVKQRVLKKLKTECNKTYTDENLMISATHSHSCTGGYMEYFLYTVSSNGFSCTRTKILVDGIVTAICQAEANMKPQSNILVNIGNLSDANINRSPTAFWKDPQSEKAMFNDARDQNMTQMTFLQNGDPFGLINWFAVHGTSMNNTNTLISGDNKGYAAYCLERSQNRGASPGQGSFVAAFASSCVGDMSPNLQGAKCIDTGLPCEMDSSTCNGRNEVCIAMGPGKNMEDSTRIIGERQAVKARELLGDSSTPCVEGDVRFVHTYINMGNLKVINVKFPNDTVADVTTCPAALGYSFAAGTTDGPGEFDFTQGTTTSGVENPYWQYIGDIVTATPSQEQKDCQSPKPILLNVGEAKLPYQWVSNIVPIQIFKIGCVFLLGVPGEFTIVASLRLREAIKNIIINQAGCSCANPTIIVCGLSNLYSHYITTYEEYQIQRYEGASTLFGPHTLSGYLQEFEKLAEALCQRQKVAPVEKPTDLIDHQYLPAAKNPFCIPALYVSCQPPATVSPGDVVSVSFALGYPSAYYVKIYAQVNKVDPGNSKQRVATDADFNVKVIWANLNATVIWDTSDESNCGNKYSPGYYEICYYSCAQSLDKFLCTNTFLLLDKK